MKVRFRKWILVTCGIAAVVSAAWCLLLGRVFSYSRELAHPILLAPDFALKIEGVSIPAIEKAFWVSSHGGLHGDGTAVTAYRLGYRDMTKFVRTLEERTSALGWNEQPARYTPIAQLGHLFPEEFRLPPDERLRYGRTADFVTEYYIDARHATVYVANHTY